MNDELTQDQKDLLDSMTRPEEPEEPRNIFVDWIEGETDELDEHSVYKVNVKSFKGNPVHAAILMTGFDNGAYSAILSQGTTYEPRDYIHIEKVAKIADMPSHGPFPHEEENNG